MVFEVEIFVVPKGVDNVVVMVVENFLEVKKNVVEV